MKDEVKTFFALLLEEFGVRTRWLIVGALIIIMVGLFAVYEHITLHHYYNNVDSHIGAVERLNHLANDGIQKDTLLVAPYEEIVQTLSDNPIEPLSSRLSSSVQPEPILIFLTSTIFLIFGLIGAFSNKKKRFAAVSGTLMLIALFSVIGFSLPVVFHPSINYLLMLALQLTAISLYMFKIRRLQDKAKMNACRANMRTLSSQTIIYKYHHKTLPTKTHELLAAIPLFAQIVCPSCKARFEYHSDGEDYEIRCPNQPSHGRIENGNVSWETE